jgi:hypothetical protein
MARHGGELLDPAAPADQMVVPIRGRCGVCSTKVRRGWASTLDAIEIGPWVHVDDQRDDHPPQHVIRWEQ